jgi:hypothetical protein
MLTLRTKPEMWFISAIFLIAVMAHLFMLIAVLVTLGALARIGEFPLLEMKTLIERVDQLLMSAPDTPCQGFFAGIVDQRKGP